MSTFERTFEVLQETGLNWSVAKKPLVYSVTTAING